MSSSTVQGHCPFRAKQLQLISPSRHLPLLFLQRHELLSRSFCSKAQFTHFPVLSSTRTVPTSAMVVRGSTKPLASTASNSQAHTDRPSLIYFQRHLRGNKLVFQRQSAILQWAAPIYHRRLPIPTRFEHYRECWKALEHQCCSTALDMCQCKYCKLAQTNPQNHDTYILWRSLNILNCNCMNWTNIACYSTSVHDLSTVANHDFGSELPWASSEIRQRMALPMTPSQTASRPQTATQSTSTITSSDTIPCAFAYHLARNMNEMQDTILNN
jgi:hypothetical protein